MVPVIDISLVGTLTAIWAACKVIFSVLGKGIDWIAKKALAALVGSKFWATAFFCGICAFLIGIFYRLIRLFGSAIIDTITPNLSFDDDTFVILSYIFPLDALGDFLSFLLSLLTSYLLITQTQFMLQAFLKFYNLITSGWKT